MNAGRMTAGYGAALAAETLKARRSKVPLATLAVATFAGGMAAVFMFVLRDPERARDLGLLRQKADLSGLTADWPGLLDFLAQVAAVGDLMLFAFVVTWVFGRESSDGTLRYLLALPVPRTTIVMAKFTLTAVWCAATNLWLAATVLGAGWALGLPGASAGVVLTGLGDAGLAAALMLVVTTPLALAASAGRGYLAPLATALVTLVLGQVLSALGWAGVFPWAVPAVAAGLVPGTALSAAGVIAVTVTGVAGVVGAVTWWRSGQAG